MSVYLYTKHLWNDAKGIFAPGVLEVSGERFVAFHWGTPKGVLAKQKIRDLGSAHICPSAVDLHVHTRDFDETHKETFESLEAAAFKGGVVAAACMANTFPRLDSVKRVKEFFSKTKTSRVEFRPFAAVTENLEGVRATDWSALLKMPVVGLSDDGKPVLNENMLSKALLAVKRTNKIISLHEEDTTISQHSLLHESDVACRWGLSGSSAEAEWKLVERDLQWAKKLKAPIHIAHVSSRESLVLIAKARRAGVRVSTEVTPHHALLSVDTAESLSLGDLSLFKVCPVIRGEEDRRAILRALKDGNIDCMASDHAPHSIHEKEQCFEEAAHGMIGLENFFPLYNEIRLQSGMTWARFFAAFRTKPAALYGGSRDLMAFGPKSEASFLIVDPDKKNRLQWNKSKSTNTPLHGREVRGEVLEHWIRGKCVYGKA